MLFNQLWGMFALRVTSGLGFQRADSSDEGQERQAGSLSHVRFTDAERRIAETRLASAEKEFTRLARLFKGGIASRADYDAAKSKYDLAESETQIALGKGKIVGRGQRFCRFLEQAPVACFIARACID